MNKIEVLFMFACFTICNAQQVEIENFVSGLSNPVNIKHAGDSRLFIVEQYGFIQIVDENGILNPSPFLDINSNVIDSGGEQGLLGLAFHPDYATNGFFYVNYINNNGDTVLSRFTRDTSGFSNPESELILLNITQPYSNHNGGDLAFGPDGYLYISTGDGGSVGDPNNRAQDLTSLLGKLLRIDVDNGSTYTIPADNPFPNVDNPDALPEIWAYGLRNPWKFSFDKLTNELWIADVGQFEIEEINRVSPSLAGLNFGWRCYEGNAIYDTSIGCPDTNSLTFPIAQYTHAGNGPSKCAITGGYIYRGTAQPSLDGLYFFADYCSNEIGVLQDIGTGWNMTFTQQYFGNNWSAFGEDINGELYIAGVSSGNIFKIIDANLGVPENELSSVKMYPNPASDILTLDFSTSNLILSTVNIFDIHGKLIKSITNFDEDITNISTKNFTNGFYLVQMIGANGSKKINKLIINK